MNENLKLKLQSLPNNSGCYLMKDASDTIIYVGKAKDLKKRVNQYFIGAHDYKTTKLVSNIVDFDYIVTNTEKEALILEINLIKENTPRYNIMFMDDKSYPYIKLTKNGYPSLKVVREFKKDPKAKYFGPYPDVLSARKTLKLLDELYPLRKCKRVPKKVCLFYHLNHCLGPCEFSIAPEVISEMIENVTNFLNGNTDDIISDLKRQMDEATFALEYEKAIKLRNLILSIDSTTAKQSVDLVKFKEVDVFNYYLDKGYISIQGLLIRNGKLLEKTLSLTPIYDDYYDEFISFLMQYYSKHQLSKEIILPLEFKDSIIVDTLDTKLSFPHHGLKANLVKLAKTNAQKHHETNFDIIYKKQEVVSSVNDELKVLFNKSVKRIEIFDNSHISGKHNVSAMVVFIDGQPSRKDYRYYKLEEGSDDLKSMHEVLYRRYFRLLKEQQALPDLLVVDGGKTQINVANEVVASLGLDILIVGLVKDERHQTKDLMDQHLNIIDLEKKSALFFFLTRMQDEVHRFVLAYHQKLRQKAQTTSELDSIIGLGPQRKAKLMKKFKSFKAIKEASMAELSEVLPDDVASSVYLTFLNE